MELEDYRSRLLAYIPLRRKVMALQKQKTHLAMKVETLENFKPVVAGIRESNAKLERLYKEQVEKIVELEKYNSQLGGKLS
jgi:hypothetical protein